jgi:hypothetical protein
MIIRNKKLLLAMLPITAATIILLWVRFEYGLMFIAAVPTALCFKGKSDFIKKIAAITGIIIFSAIIFIYQFNNLAKKAESLLDKYTITRQSEQARLETMDKIYKSRGPLRLLNIPLAMLNLTPKNLHHIYTDENKLYDIVLLSDIYQWWLPLPFLIIGAVIIIGRRTDFLGLLVPYIIALITSALLLGGLTADLLRYRDSLVPVAFIVIGVGVESFSTSPKGWKNKVIITAYSLFVLLAIYFLIRDF